MNNQPPSQAAMETVQSRLLLCAVYALMESHPNAASFRESWAHALSLLQRDLLRPVMGNSVALADLNAAFAQLLPTWQGYFPDSDAARSKP